MQEKDKPYNQDSKGIKKQALLRIQEGSHRIKSKHKKDETVNEQKRTESYISEKEIDSPQ